jgi:hypothetical protein
VDGELGESELPMVLKHLDSCRSCGALLAADASIPRGAGLTVEPPSPALPTPTGQLPLLLRIALVVVGTVILVGSGPNFIRGNTSGDALHDLRHLAIWQVAVGLAVISAAVTFRLSRILAVAVGTFLSLTCIAVIYDLLTGHRGPWTDPVHVVEVLAVLLLIAVAWPRLRLAIKSGRRPQVRVQDSYRSR